MALPQIPAIDINACSGWSEQDINLYNLLPFYLTKMQIEYRKTKYVWPRFTGKKRWQQNMGPIMRSVTKEPSPNIRQMFTPVEISGSAKKDVIDVRERSCDEAVYRHKFESLTFGFVPNFRDFLTDHVDFCNKDITEKITRADDVFIRTRVFHRSPFVWVTGAAVDANGQFELKTAPVGIGNAAGTDGKTTGYLQALIGQLGPAGYLSFEQINKALSALENDIGAPPFSGSSIPDDNKGLDGLFALVTSGEQYNQFTFDPWLLAHKNCDLDVINGRFQGRLFGRVTCIMERFPLRHRVDASMAAPEVRELGPQAYNKGETVPNPQYTRMDDAQGSPYEWAFLVGAEGYDSIETGPPPGVFASNGMPEGFGKMDWNGKTTITKNLLIPCYDDNQVLYYDTNKYGEYLQIIASNTFGTVAKQPRYTLPMFFARKRGQ